MPSVQYYNQTAPFWDFIANLEASGGEHPFFGAFGSLARDANSQSGWNSPPTLPGGRNPPPYRDHPHEHPHDHPHGPSPPTEPHHPKDSQDPPSDSPPSAEPHHHHGPPQGEGPHGGSRSRSPHRRGPGCGWGHRGGHRRGGFGGGRGRGRFANRGPSGFDMSSIAQFLSQFGVDMPSTNPFDASTPQGREDGAEGEGVKAAGNGKDFTPAADVFDTEEAYVIHLSLPGAKKENISVNYDADKSEVSVAGVITRPGEEEFLKTLAMDEREVGVFERKVRIGSRAHPAMIETDAISAKMEDGVLIITVPKVDREYVEVTKVDIE